MRTLYLVLSTLFAITPPNPMYTVPGQQAIPAQMGRPAHTINELHIPTTAGQTSFALNWTPLPGSSMVYKNGLRLVPGVDFTISLNNVQLVPAQVGDQSDYFLVDYDH